MHATCVTKEVLLGGDPAVENMGNMRDFHVAVCRFRMKAQPAGLDVR